METYIQKAYQIFARPNREAPVDDSLSVEQWTKLLGEEYLDKPDDSARMFPYWSAFANEVAAQFDYLSSVITFDFTPNDPVNPVTGLPDMLYLKRNLIETGVMPVYTGDSDNPILSRIIRPYNGKLISANDMFRAVHDVLGHFASGAEFNFLDEIKAYRHHFRTFSSQASVALYCETMGQLTAGRVSGNFPAQKCIYLDNYKIPG